MAYEFREMGADKVLEEINFNKQAKYADVYQKILNLRNGDGFCIDLDTAREAINMRNTISTQLKRKRCREKYVVSNRGNKFYCGRVK